MNRRPFGGLVLGSLMLATLGLTGGNAEAKSLEDILKEKGVITAEEYAEASKKNDLAYYQPGRGLTVESRDGKFRTSLGGYTQLRYTYLDADQGQNSSDFRVMRFKVQLQGHIFTKNLGYRLQEEVREGFTTEDAYLSYSFSEAFKLQVGQYKPPQARQELTSNARQLFVERSLANDTFNLGRDLGIQATGSFADNLVEYGLGVFNGNGPNKRNPDTRHMVTGRLDLNPLGAYPLDEAGWPRDKPLLNLGSSFAWQKVGVNDIGGGFDRDNDLMDVALNLDQARYTTTATTNGGANFLADFGRDLTWLIWTANANATWQGATIAAEYYRLNADPALGSAWNADGYYLQAGYQVIPEKLELAVRYSAVKSDDSNASAKFEMAETQVGANYYFYKHNLKLMTDLTFHEDDRSSNQDATTGRLQLVFAY